jgi:hypothetical protein
LGVGSANEWGCSYAQLLNRLGYSHTDDSRPEITCSGKSKPNYTAARSRIGYHHMALLLCSSQIEGIDLTIRCKIGERN